MRNFRHYFSLFSSGSCRSFGVSRRICLGKSGMEPEEWYDLFDGAMDVVLDPDITETDSGEDEEMQIVGAEMIIGLLHEGGARPQSQEPKRTRQKKARSQTTPDFSKRFERLHRVFVYGTLKRGEPNYERTATPTVENNMGQAHFVAIARTIDLYPLVIASKYNIPYLLDAKGSGHHVLGEVFEVNSAMLKFMDWFEGHPKYYVRERCEVEILSGKEDVEGGNCETMPAETSGPADTIVTVDVAKTTASQSALRALTTDERLQAVANTTAVTAFRPGDTTTCWVYKLKQYKPAMLEMASMAFYESAGAHGLEYVARYARTDESYDHKTDVLESLPKT